MHFVGVHMKRLSSLVALLLLCAAEHVRAELATAEGMGETVSTEGKQRLQYTVTARMVPRPNTERQVDVEGDHRDLGETMKDASDETYSPQISLATTRKTKIRVASIYGDSTIVVDRPFAVKLKPSHRKKSYFEIVLAYCGFDCNDDTHCGDTVAMLTHAAPVGCLTGGTCKFEFVGPEILQGNDRGQYRVRVTDVSDESLFECSGPIDVLNTLT